jgi:hypothetical protein
MRQTWDTTWHSRGTTWLWDEAALPALGPAADAWSLRRWLRTVDRWPSELAGPSGESVLVAGLDMALDAQPAAEAESWLAEVLKPAVMSFQSAYDGGGALVFWLPTGRNRMLVKSATDAVTWACGGADHGKALDFGRILWGVAGQYPQQVLLQPGGAPAGLFHARIT